MNHIALVAYVVCRNAARRLRCERGEGVVSTAIAVLIMAFLGALMWIGFREIWLDAQDATREQVGEIGR